MDVLRTYLLIIPYITVITYFFVYRRDNFFLKIRSSNQLLLILILLGMVFINIMIWKGFFEDYTFLNFDIKNTVTQFKTTALVTVLAAIAAVFGWIFTSRVQIINTTRSHSVQILMNSRNSTIYINKVDEATIIKRRLTTGVLFTKLTMKKMLRNKKFVPLESLSVPYKSIVQLNQRKSLSQEMFLNLEHDEKSAITYLLNFLEFVAIGIRHNNLDEDLIKGSFRSILKSNYVLFQPVIEGLRKLETSNTYNQLEMLHKRWDEEKHAKCNECKTWYKISDKNGKIKVFLKYLGHVVATLLTCGTWLAMIMIMKLIEILTRHTEDENFICIDCAKEKNKTLKHK